MIDSDAASPEDAWSPGWRCLAVAALAYSACAVAATWPRALTAATQLPNACDPVTHLWTLRWYRACLLEGSSPYFNPGIQAPVGSPIGLVPPLQFQALLYLLASSLTSNDILCYNAIWFASYVLAGVGTFWLAWYVARDRACAGLAGLLAMLSGPMMAHGFGHLELIQVGWFPLFLIAWTRMVNRPGRRRLLASAGLYLLVAMSAPFFAVFAVFPAATYAAWSMARACRVGGGGGRAWLAGRAGWACAFLGLAGAGLAALYSGQVWAALHGFTVTRPRGEFLRYGAPPWGYLMPTRNHLLGRLLPADPYEASGLTAAGERGSYLGVVTLLLLNYGAMRCVRFPRASYWWAAFSVLVVLSFGGVWQIGTVKVPLPASWFLDSVSPLRLIRVPARFNLFAAVCSAVIAGAALKELLGRIGRPGLRPVLAGALMLVALVDLSVVPFCSTEIQGMPACYAAMKRLDPGASFAEVPQYPSAYAADPNALRAYWQSFHRGRTTAGYTAHPNSAFDGLVYNSSPFSIEYLANPQYLANPDNSSFDLMSQVGFRDYVWLYLTRHDLRYVVLHKRPMDTSGFPAQLDRAQSALRDARVFEDADAIVFDRSRLPAPSKPVALFVEGWSPINWSPTGDRTRSMERIGRLAVFNPDPARELSLSLEVDAFRQARTARLLSGGTELARLRIEPGPRKLVVTPPFRLPAGLQELAIESDGADRPTRHRDIPNGGDRRPISLRVASILLAPRVPEPAVASKDPKAPR